MNNSEAGILKGLIEAVNCGEINLNCFPNDDGLSFDETEPEIEAEIGSNSVSFNIEEELRFIAINGIPVNCSVFELVSEDEANAFVEIVQQDYDSGVV